MAITNFTELLSAISNWHQRSYSSTSGWDSTRAKEGIAIFENCANRRLRVRQMESTSAITMTSGVGTIPTDYLQWRMVRWQQYGWLS